MINKQLLFLVIWLTASACSAHPSTWKPTIEQESHFSTIQQLPPAFEDETDLSKEWNKERIIGSAFAQDGDLYRAITAYKRALILLPKSEKQKRLEIQAQIIHSYYLGKKYVEAIATFESSDLKNIDSSFTAFQDLIVILHDCYRKIGKEHRQKSMEAVLKHINPSLANELQLSTALLSADLASITQLASKQSGRRYIPEFMEDYKKKMKDPSKARLFNALLPGSGYWYVEQKSSAVTSFLLNGLFSAAAIHFFDRGDTAAGVITAGFEMGWYIGGINGAGLAANHYNKDLYEKYATKVLVQEKLFPLFFLQHSF